jgi:hypothetical protein
MPRFILACVVLFFFTVAAYAVDPLAGHWSGYWISDSNGHRGPLRAIVFPSPTGYDVRFSGRFAHVIPFVYRQHLNVVGTSGDAVILSAERRIPFFGTFRTDVVALPNQFDATFRSGKDCGRFVLSR